MDYGSSEYNAVLLEQITDYWSLEQNPHILRKKCDGITADRIVGINDPTADEERCSSESLITAVTVYLFGEKGDLSVY